VELIRRIFCRTNVIRMSGVAVLGVVLSLFSLLGIVSDDSRRPLARAETWGRWFELGIIVTALALTFVAIGLLMGLPEDEKQPERTPPPKADHWS
jgi:hypothetical protein